MNVTRDVIEAAYIGSMATYFAFLFREMWRKRYREEREHPELIDLGGES